MPTPVWRQLDLVCPVCRGDLVEEASGEDDSHLTCSGCGAGYPVILDIPDLRTRPDPYIGFEEDRAKGRTLAAVCEGLAFADALEVYYRLTSVVTAAQSKAFIASVLAGAGRARDTLAAIEAERGLAEGPLLDLGCGTAPLALDAAARYEGVVGVDLAFRWLVMARIRLTASSVEVPLICACAEALPFPDETFGRVVGESVVEHLEDQTLALRETARVLMRGADLCLTTPNRLSLGPDPHVGLPAGGYLPERWVAAYIRRKGGIPPRRTLLSASSLQALLRETGFRDISIGLPGLSEERRAGLRGPLRWGASAYQAALGIAPLRAVLRRIGPLLSATAVKAPGAGTADPRAASAPVAAPRQTDTPATFA